MGVLRKPLLTMYASHLLFTKLVNTLLTHDVRAMRRKLEGFEGSSTAFFQQMHHANLPCCGNFLGQPEAVMHVHQCRQQGGTPFDDGVKDLVDRAVHK